MDFWRNLECTVRVELTSADLCSAMAAIQRAGLLIWDVESSGELSIRFRIRRREWITLCSMFEKRGEELALLERSGLYWVLKDLQRRPVLVLGMLLLLAFSLWVPGRVFFVQVQGNTAIETRRIAEAAAECGITFGAARREVRSEKMKNALLEAIPELSWAGVNTYGCTAVISVRERAAEQTTQENWEVSSMIASRDGIIRQITVLRGNGLCTVGQAVRAGEVLISGYTDCGIAIQATNAQGEVFAETSRDLTAVCPVVCSMRGEILQQTKKYSLIIGKKRIIFSNNSGISGTGCAKIYEENYLTLPGGFVLPVAIAVETCTFYESEEADWSYDLSTASRQYLVDQMCAGRILLAKEELTGQEGLLVLQGSYSCYEMIGITRIEESILDYVEND